MAAHQLGKYGLRNAETHSFPNNNNRQDPLGHMISPYSSLVELLGGQEQMMISVNVKAKKKIKEQACLENLWINRRIIVKNLNGHHPYIKPLLLSARHCWNITTSTKPKSSLH